jgi:hypothetical protein
MLLFVNHPPHGGRAPRLRASPTSTRRCCSRVSINWDSRRGWRPACIDCNRHILTTQPLNLKRGKSQNKSQTIFLFPAVQMHLTIYTSSSLIERTAREKSLQHLELTTPQIERKLDRWCATTKATRCKNGEGMRPFYLSVCLSPIIFPVSSQLTRLIGLQAPLQSSSLRIV